MLRALFLLFLVGTLTFSAEAQKINFLAAKAPNDYPSDSSVTVDEVYGYVKYTVKRITTTPGAVTNPLDQFKVIVKNLLGNKEEGAITITLEVLNGSNLLVKQPIMVLEWKDQRLLFSPRSQSNVDKIDESRTVLNWLPVTHANNKLTVKLGVYATASSNLDLGSLQKIVSLGQMLASASADTNATKVAFDSVQNILNELIGTSTADTKEHSRELAFIQAGAPGTPDKLKLSISFDALVGGDAKVVTVPIEVEFDTLPTRLAASFSSKKFIQDSIDAPTVFGKTLKDQQGSVTVLAALRASTESPDVRIFLDDLMVKNKFVGPQTLASRCEALYNALANFYKT